MTISSKILCDADFVIALFLDTDSNHQKAFDIYNSIDSSLFVILNITIYEVATLLSRFLPQSEAIYTL